MDVKELRIGNLFQTIANDIRDVDIKELTRIQGMPYLYKPIPLTEEWLVKFGFSKSFFTISNFFKKDIYLNIDNKGKWTFNLAEGIGVYLTDIKHVHQLQNLYFALTNEELKLK